MGPLQERPRDLESATIRLGGFGALLAGIVFLVTIAYTFGFLFTRGLSTEMLDDPARLLPWVDANKVPYVALWWIFVLHLLLLLPAPAALAAIAGPQRPTIRLAATCGVAGAVVGMVAAMVNASTAPALGNAAVTLEPGLLPQVWIASALAGSFGLHLRLLSDLLLAIWLLVTALTLIHVAGWRALAVFQIGVAALTLIVVVAKPFDALDLEPVLGFALALAYLWIGVALLRFPRSRATTPATSSP